MPSDPKDTSIKKAVDAIQASMAKHLASILPKVIGDAFDAGGLEYAAALQRAMSAVAIPGMVALDPTPVAIQAGTLAEAGKDGRAPRGSIRKAVVTVLVAHPQGLPAVEVIARAMDVDPTISSGGIQNELSRKKGEIYVNEDGRWRLVPGLILGGDYYDLLNQNPQKDRATEP